MADLELNSIGNGDGNNYLLRDNSKIPLSGSNQISGDLVPATDNSIDIGSSTKNIKTLYTKGITIDGTQFLPSDYVPKSGGNVLTGYSLSRINDVAFFELNGGSGWGYGASISLRGKDYNNNEAGCFFVRASDSTKSKILNGSPDGTLIWDGQSIQTTSDQRFKQQINAIDDKLLDAWEDVSLVQFKYNEAVEEKGNTARLHTGYVVQQIDEACKSHNVDISKYGLYCHEEYEEETREIEHDDGTKTTEVVRPASEHYSLRYTEALIVECAYLRRENNRLKERLSKIEKLLNI